MFNEYILNNLKKTAMKSSVNNRHSAALIKKDTVLKSTSTFNKFIKPVLIRKDNCTSIHYLTIHAEVNAIYSYFNKKHVRGMDLIVIRIDNYGTKLKNSRPCNDCIIKLRKLGIRKVYYSDENGEIVFEYVNNMKFLHICSSKKNIMKNKLLTK
jgi:deoxycytidylate deaminase